MTSGTCKCFFPFTPYLMIKPVLFLLLRDFILKTLRVVNIAYCCSSEVMSSLMYLKSEDILFLPNLEKRVNETLTKLFWGSISPKLYFLLYSCLFSPWRNKTSHNSLNRSSAAVNHWVILLPLSCLSIEVAVTLFVGYTLIYSCDLQLEFMINVLVWKFAVSFECSRWRSGSCAANSLRVKLRTTVAKKQLIISLLFIITIFFNYSLLLVIITY